jgi:hypothetical protein
MTSFDILSGIETQLGIGVQSTADIIEMNEVVSNAIKEINSALEGDIPEFFKYVSRVYIPYEDIELSSKDKILSDSNLTELQKKERYDAMSAIIKELYPQTTIEFYVKTFASDYLAVMSSGLTYLALENYDSEEISTTIGTLKSKSRSIPLMIQDPSLSMEENFKMFDKTTIVGIVARNIINGLYIFDMSLLVRWLNCAYLYGKSRQDFAEKGYTGRKLLSAACYEMLFSEGEGSFYNTYAKDLFTQFFKGREYETDLGLMKEEGYITSRDNRYKKKLKTDILESYTSLYKAMISNSVVDFSFFLHAIEFIYVIAQFSMDYPDNEFEPYEAYNDYVNQRYNKIDVFKKFLEDTTMFYKALTEYTENVIELT